jgi:antitoxin component of RelBE/YafQ-DinJ toxin-antitoxin module
VDSTNPCDVTLTVTDASDTAIAQIASTISIPSDATLEAIPNKLVLKQGEKIRATATTANDLEITVSALEIT